MHRFLKLLTIAAAAAASLAIGLTASTASAAPRHAGMSVSRLANAIAVPAGAPTCDGATCYGLDPTQTYSSIDGYRCDTGAYTPWTSSQGLAAFSGPRGYVELRYGPHCHANWARISSSSPGTWFYVQNYNGDNQQYYVPSGSTSAYCNMVNGYPLARAGDLDNHTGWY